jgi:hypothetical protein
MLISIGNADQATDITVQVLGMVQSPDSALGALMPSEDTGSYSARQFITLDKSSFHLEPGGSENVTATIQIPQDVGDGGRYAIINIMTEAVAGGPGVRFAAAVNVPIFLTIKDSQLVHTGTITNLSTGNITSGQPVDIFTDFLNTGNHHFKVMAEVTVGNASGQIMGTVAVPLTASSVLSGMTRQIPAAFIPPGELAPGDYTISSKVMLEDGTVLDEAAGSFEVEQAYTPPPGTVAEVSMTPTALAASSASSTPTAGTTAGVNWTYIVLGAAGVIIVVLLVLLLRRRG